MRLGKIILLGVAVLLVTTMSCAMFDSIDLEEPENDTVSLVVGYIDMSDAPSPLNWIKMKRLPLVTDDPIYEFIGENGLFYNSHVEPGTYKFTQFGGTSSSFIGGTTKYTYPFPSQGRTEMDPIIKEQGIYFVGSYKFIKIATGIFEQGKFDIEKTDTPTEKEVLERLLEYAGETKWKSMILKRIKELE